MLPPKRRISSGLSLLIFTATGVLHPQYGGKWRTFLAGQLVTTNYVQFCVSLRCYGIQNDGWRGSSLQDQHVLP